jgi:hypothetical protein
MLPSMRAWGTGLLLVLSACSSAKESGGASADAGVPASNPKADGAAADPAATIGAFDIRLVAPVPARGSSPATPAFTSIQGRVASGPRAPTLQLNLAAQEGDCRLYTPTAPFCDPACVGGTCVTGGKCVPDPQPRNVGVVTVTGVATEPGSKPVSMAPEPPTYFYQPDGDVMTSFPPFAEGADLMLSAAGAELPAFKIAGKGIKLLEVPNEMPIPMAKGKPLPVRWLAPGRADLSRVEIDVEISHHGGFKGSITCDTADSGSLDVPATLVTKLIDLGVAGFPTVTIIRRATGQAALATGRVELNVISERELPLVVEGNTSCNEDLPCPAGKTCQQNQTCR